MRVVMKIQNVMKSNRIMRVAMLQFDTIMIYCCNHMLPQGFMAETR
ncbi:hypothetical protein POPTR_001G389650v4 [Populus trichocarpa]|uniref:Uncharacterized protein n=1 Tax=Populus trichocarpa TaxID=3694 RepID=A0ACC0TNV5_POPTR|nr:hypothetical protein POPTR_001G389650v4 [Populus trichocarpa]